MIKKYFFVCCLLLSSIINAEIKLPLFFSDHMVLQRDEPIVVFGTATAGEMVEVNFNGSTVKSETNKDGNWSVTLNAMSFGGPYKMIVKGKNTIMLSDVYLGDIWFCSGQSNMGWKLENSINGKEELANANYEKIKIFSAKRYMSGKPTTKLISSKWETCTSKTAEGFSAVAYFFGRALYKKYNIPIGLINSSYGGTNIEAWMSEELFENHPERQKIIAQMKDMDMLDMVRQFKKDDYAYRDLLEEIDLGRKQHWENENTGYSNWEILQLPNRWAFTEIERTYGVVWVTKEIKLNNQDINGNLFMSIGRVDDKDVTYFNGTKIGESDRKDLERTYEVPQKLLRLGKNRITIKVVNFRDYGGFRSADNELYLTTNHQTISLAGSWNYKIGTPNVQEPPARVHPKYYPTSLYNSMVHPFFGCNIKGVIWYQGESNTKNPEEYANFFPQMIKDWRSKWDKEIPFLFVQLANYAKQNNREATIREAQTAALKLNKTAMAVTLDIGEDTNVHPKNKQDLGKRLAMAAQNVAYGEHEITTHGPLVEKVKVKKGKVIITFTEQITIKGDNQDINGFLISDNKENFIKAHAKLVKSNTIEVESNEINNPKYVRYLWEDAPGKVMIFNNSGLPAPPFRTDK